MSSSSMPRNPDQFKDRQALISNMRNNASFAHLFTSTPRQDELYAIENFIGSIQMPVGVAGPISFKLKRILETEQDPPERVLQDVLFPLATTEAALVASVNRGLKLLSTDAPSVLVEQKGITRAPVLTCQTALQASELKQWLFDHFTEIKMSAQTTSSHLTLTNLQAWIVGRRVYTRFSADPSEAMGMNMISIALDHAIKEIVMPVWGDRVEFSALSSNLCTDKKPNTVNTLLGRGWWAQAECILSAKEVERILHLPVAQLVSIHHQKNLVGSALAGSTAQNAHVANVAAALFLATGQDPAHVVEAAQSFTTMELIDGKLYASVTIPSLQLGTVGGGTKMLYAKDAIALCGVSSTEELAGVISIGALAGELSLLGSLGERTLASAHASLRASNTQQEL